MAQKNFAVVRSTQCAVGQTVSPGDGAIVACSADGWVRLMLNSGTFIDIFAQAGTTNLVDAHVVGVGTPANTPAATNLVVNIVKLAL